MGKLAVYSDFIARVNELGFMFMGHRLEGYPSLGDETEEAQWHTGEYETDPWMWKDRGAEEKQLAFGCILNGHKGFIAPRCYALFYAAYYPGETLKDRWEAGELSHETWKVWQLFERQPRLSTAEIRSAMGVTLKHGASHITGIVEALQQEYYLTVAGARRKLSRNGEPFGWPANVYAPVLRWIPPEWLAGSAEQNPADARELILDIAMMSGGTIPREVLAKGFGF